MWCIVKKEELGTAGGWLKTIYGRFASDFVEDSLANLCDPIDGVQTGPFGSQLHKKDYVSVGTPIITVEHLGDNRILHEDVPLVSDHDRERLSKYILNHGDIVFSRVGSVDRRALVKESESGWLFSGRCLRVRPGPEQDRLGLPLVFLRSAILQRTHQGDCGRCDDAVSQHTDIERHRGSPPSPVSMNNALSRTSWRHSTTRSI